MAARHRPIAVSASSAVAPCSLTASAQASPRSIRLGRAVDINQGCLGCPVTAHFEEPLSRKAQVPAWSALALRTLQSKSPVLVLRAAAARAPGHDPELFIGQGSLRAGCLRALVIDVNTTRAEVSAEPQGNDGRQTMEVLRRRSLSQVVKL